MNYVLVLGVDPGAPLSEIEWVWRERAREVHPDAGGDAGAVAARGAAMDEIRRERGAA